MLDLASAILSRTQFGFTIGFHILFPTFNIGLAVFISIMETLWLKTRNPIYLQICKFWTKIFALTFGMGVVSGIVLSYELGTNFSGFTNAVGGVLGPLFSYEVLSAFFLEAGFLGVMLFGWNRVGRKLHYTATLLVTIGTIISAFWILSANSWMQTPAGYTIVNNKFIVSSWQDVIFNPSTIPRFLHMLFASLLTSAFVVAGISAWYLLKKRHLEIAKPCLKVAMVIALIFSPLQILLGDGVGLIMHEYQPIKTAAMEANWSTMKGAPLILFAWPDQTAAKNLYEISIPKAASLINTHDLDGELIGLDSVPPADRPNVAAVFFSFRIMVAIGGLMLLIACWSLWLRLRGKLFTSNFFQYTCIAAIPSGFLATIAGWLTAEFGRQPWIVHGLLRTNDSASQIPATHVTVSLTLFIIVYSIIFSFYLFYLIKFIQHGPIELKEKIPNFTYMQETQERE